MMNRAEAERRGLPVQATLRSFVPVAVEPGTMGTAPLVAVSGNCSLWFALVGCTCGGLAKDALVCSSVGRCQWAQGCAGIGREGCRAASDCAHLSALSPCPHLRSQVPKALERAGISKEDVEVFELNEAFASQVNWGCWSAGCGWLMEWERCLGLELSSALTDHVGGGAGVTRRAPARHAGLCCGPNAPPRRSGCTCCTTAAGDPACVCAHLPAPQFAYCMEQLGLPEEKVNPCGGGAPRGDSLGFSCLVS